DSRRAVEPRGDRAVAPRGVSARAGLCSPTAGSSGAGGLGIRRVPGDLVRQHEVVRPGPGLHASDLRLPVPGQYMGTLRELGDAGAATEVVLYQRLRH